MFTTPALNFRNLEFNAQCDSPPSPAMSKRSAESSAETVKEFAVQSIDEIDIAQLLVKPRGLQKSGKMAFSASYANSKLLVNLTPKKKWLLLPFSIESSRFAKKEEGNTETVRVQVSLDDEVAKVLRKIGDHVRDQVAAHVPDLKWCDSVKCTEHGELFTGKVVLKAPDDKNLTACTVRPFKKEVIKAMGKEALGPLLEANRGFAKSKVKLVVALHAIWFMKESETDNWVKGSKDSTMAGITWRVTNLVADVPEQTRYVFQDVFEDVVFEEDEEA